MFLQTGGLSFAGQEPELAFNGLIRAKTSIPLKQWPKYQNEQIRHEPAFHIGVVLQLKKP